MSYLCILSIFRFDFFMIALNRIDNSEIKLTDQLVVMDVL